MGALDYDYRRNDWGARSAKGVTKLVASKVTRIFNHWPGSKGTIGTSKSTIVKYLRGWQDYHMDGRGWTDIAYSIAVDQNGKLWELRGLDRADGATANQGGKSVSVLAVLGTKEKPSAKMLARLRAVNKALVAKFPNASVGWHAQVKSTDCPGPDLIKWFKAGMPVTEEADPLIMFVAGSANTADDKLHAKYKRRLDVALGLLRKDATLKVVVTGGVKAGHKKSEAANAKEYLVAQGIPASRIIEESKSGSTNGNFTYGLPLAAKAGATSVAVVSDFSHLRRCLAFFYAANKKLGLGLRIGAVGSYKDAEVQDATVAQTVEQSRAVWPGMTYTIVEQLDEQWGITAKPPSPPAPGGAPAFPLPAGYWFGPKAGGARSVSGYYNRSFGGKTDRAWLKQWQTQAKKAGLYKGGIDGLYGPLTAAAAKAVQRKAGLSVDGLIGAKTWPATWAI